LIAAPERLNQQEPSRMGGDRGALVSFDSHGCPQFAAKFFIMFDVQLATHGLAFGFATFGIEQNPLPPSGSTWHRVLYCVAGGVFLDQSSSRHRFGEHFCVGFPAHKRKRALDASTGCPSGVASAMAALEPG
jgi:hypothetical protein